MEGLGLGLRPSDPKSETETLSPPGPDVVSDGRIGLVRLALLAGIV